LIWCLRNDLRRIWDWALDLPIEEIEGSIVLSIDRISLQRQEWKFRSSILPKGAQIVIELGVARMTSRKDTNLLEPVNFALPNELQRPENTANRRKERL
jgi:hypothetical protein